MQNPTCFQLLKGLGDQPRWRVMALVALACPNTHQRLDRSRQHEEAENGKQKQVHQPFDKDMTCYFGSLFLPCPPMEGK